MPRAVGVSLALHLRDRLAYTSGLAGQARRMELKRGACDVQHRLLQPLRQQHGDDKWSRKVQ